MNFRTWTIAGLLMAIGVTDAGMKAFALNSFPDEHTALGAGQGFVFLTLAIHRNPGIAFDIPIPLGIVLPITLLICLAFARIAYTHKSDNLPQSLGALATVIGALGNGIDRLVNGFTTDYLIFFSTSAINLSDVLILLGILAVVWYDKRIPNPKHASETSE